MDPDAVKALNPESLPDELFRVLTESSTVGIAVYARDRVLYANPALETITGRPVAEILDQSPLDSVHPEDREWVEERLEQRMRGERPATERFEVRFLAGDGSVRWIDITTSRILWRDEPAAVATVVDITERKQAELVLEESRERLDLAQQAARYVTWEWNVESDELLVDPKVEEIHGLTREQVGRTGREFLEEVVHPDDRHLIGRAMERARTGEAGSARAFEVEVRFILPDGRVRWVGERARLLPAEKGRPRRVIGVATDIDDRKRAEHALLEERDLAQVTLASIGDGVIRTDAEGRIDYLNPVAEKLTGWSLERALGRALSDVYTVVDESSRKPLADPLRTCLDQRRTVELPGNAVLLDREGREHVIQDSASPIFGRDGRLAGAVLVFKDMTQMRGMEQEVSYLATHDPLTGLINRHEFERMVARVLERVLGGGRPASLGYLDLDEFKLINDTCGHVAGDELLQNLAEMLGDELPAGSTLARLGGDEFGVLLEDTTPRRAVRTAERLRDAIRALRFEWEERPFTMGVSVGLVHLDGEMETAAELLSAADAACYVAKEEGRNRIHVYQPDDRRLAERYGEMHWVHRIHRAFDEGRFRLHRQVIQPLGSAPPMAEIFIRMLDDDGGLIPPGQFIPAAERFHLIPSVDRWVTRTAFQRLAADGPDDAASSFALNVSGQSLGDESFLEDVVSELEASGLDPERICFEITETAAVSHLARANRFIAVLRGMGCRFVLDDFGTGLSSFSYLKNLQVDYLKLSGEFVRGMAGNEVQWTLARSIHELGKLMGMRTIAEGVETAAEMDAVRDIGFDYAQGYWIERPRAL